MVLYVCNLSNKGDCVMANACNGEGEVGKVALSFMWYVREYYSTLREMWSIKCLEIVFHIKRNMVYQMLEILFHIKRNVVYQMSTVPIRYGKRQREI